MEIKGKVKDNMIEGQETLINTGVLRIRVLLHRRKTQKIYSYVFSPQKSVFSNIPLYYDLKKLQIGGENV